MVNRLVSVGDDLTLPPAVKVANANLPAALQPTALNATYASLSALGAKADTSAVTAAVAPKLDSSIAASGARPASVATVSTNVYLGTTSRRVVGTELDRVSLILKAPAGQAMLVAAGTLNSTTDPGSGYVTVAAGSEILITDVLPVWAYLATSAEAVAMTKGMVA